MSATLSSGSTRGSDVGLAVTNPDCGDAVTSTSSVAYSAVVWFTRASGSLLEDAKPRAPASVNHRWRSASDAGSPERAPLLPDRARGRDRYRGAGGYRQEEESRLPSR